MTPNDKPDAAKQKRMWGGRFDEDTDKLVEAFNASIDVDQKMALQDIQGSIAHATMLAEQQILSQDEAAQIIDGLDHIKQDILEGRFAWKVELEDVHMNIERALTERIGAVGGKLHTARSRNDQVATDFRLWLREATHGLAKPAIGRVKANRPIIESLTDTYPHQIQKSGCEVAPCCAGRAG